MSPASGKANSSEGQYTCRHESPYAYMFIQVRARAKYIGVLVHACSYVCMYACMHVCML